jgi:hypothetical protein
MYADDAPNASKHASKLGSVDFRIVLTLSTIILLVP